MRRLLARLATWIKLNRSFLTIFVVSVSVHLLLALVLPVTQDEAYYKAWSGTPDLGYFDHPPFIAWLIHLGGLVGDGAFLLRFGPVLLSALSFPIFVNLCRMGGLGEKPTLVTALILNQFNLAAIVVGVVATPDVPQAFAWTLALHEAARALKGKNWAWITTGLVIGCGLWGKYSMVLTGPVLLWSLLKKPQLFRSPWPYAGGFACLLVFAPHLWWNYENGWVPLRFQMNHGLRGNHESGIEPVLKLPSALPAMEGTAEAHLGSFFLLPEDLAKEKPKLTRWERVATRLENFAASQLLLWGALLVPVLSWGALWIMGRNRWRPKRLDPDVGPLLHAATWFPLFLFGVIAFSQSVEGNWPAIYVVTGSALAATVWRKPKQFAVAALVNVALLIAATGMARAGKSFGNPKRDRLLQESHGYAALSSALEGLDAPLFADRYQTVAMLRYYHPALSVNQWPGITRLSEFTRRPAMITTSTDEILAAGGFWLITDLVIPPRLPGFHPISMAELRDCVGEEKLKQTEAFATPTFQPPCEARVHRWFLMRYEILDDAEAIDQSASPSSSPVSSSPDEGEGGGGVDKASGESVPK